MREAKPFFAILLISLISSESSAHAKEQNTTSTSWFWTTVAAAVTHVAMDRLANRPLEHNENKIADEDTLLDDRTLSPPPYKPTPKVKPPSLSLSPFTGGPGCSATIVPRGTLTLPTNIVSYYWRHAAAFFDQLASLGSIAPQRGPIRRLTTQLVSTLITNHIPRTERNVAVVLGAGGLRDVPIGMLLANFDRVVLVDITYRAPRIAQRIRAEVRSRIGEQHRRYATLGQHLQLIAADLASLDNHIFLELAALRPNLVMSSMVTTALLDNRNRNTPQQIADRYVGNLITLVQQSRGYIYYADTPSSVMVDENNVEEETFPYELDFNRLFAALNARLRNTRGSRLDRWQFANPGSLFENINVVAGTYSHR